jgi:hypothetical protein
MGFVVLNKIYEGKVVSGDVLRHHEHAASVAFTDYIGKQ